MIRQDSKFHQTHFCHLVVHSGQDVFCDCFEGIPEKLCKQSVGLLYKTGTIEVEHNVCSKPLGLGAKRKRGRPKKLPQIGQSSSILFGEFHQRNCQVAKEPLATEPAKSGKAPVGSYYHQPSPDVSMIEMPVPVIPIRPFRPLSSLIFP